MSCIYCGSNEEDPPSPCVSFTRYECGTEYRDGDYMQSGYCESLVWQQAATDRAKEEIRNVKIKLEQEKLLRMIDQVKARR